MKRIFDDRRTFLSIVAIAGLLYLMAAQGKDYAVEVVALAGGVGMINAWEKVKSAKPKK